MIYFAKLDGDMVGIDHYCRFEAANDGDALEQAEQYAMQNYSQYGEPYDEDDGECFCATIEPWDDEKHGDYIGDACFTDYLRTK